MSNPEDLARRFADIMNSHDARRFEELVPEDYINHNPFVAPGRAGLIAFMSQWFEAIPDTQVTVEDVLVSGDSVVGRYTYRGRHSGTFMGVPASGAEVAMRSIDIWRVRDGLLVEHWDELNSLEVFQQIGAIPAPSGDAGAAQGRQ